MVAAALMFCALSAAAAARLRGGASAGGIPFGPWRLPDSLFAPPYTGTVLALRPQDAIARLDAARRAHMRVFVILERSRRYHQNADKSFDLDRWRQEIETFRGVDFESYVADGTLLGHMLIDEPHDPTNWNGAPVPFATIDSAAAISKALWPSLATGVTAPLTFLAAARWRWLDWGFAQYRPNKGDLREWLGEQSAGARRSGLGLVVSLNVLDGNGRDRPMTADQLRTFGLELAAEPEACAITMWRYDAAVFARPDIQAAARAIAAVAAAHPARSCRRRGGP